MGPGVGQRSTYSDRYFDLPDNRLTDQGQELRVRTVTDDAGRSRVPLTYKEPPVDDASGSKPEHETTVTDAEVLVTVLSALDAVRAVLGELGIEAGDLTTDTYADAVAAHRAR